MTEKNPEIDEIEEGTVEEAENILPTSDVHHSREFMDTLSEALEEQDESRVLELFEDMHAADIADLLEFLPSKNRRTLVSLLGDKLPPELFIEVEGEAQFDLYEAVSNEQIADAVTELDTDDAVYVIEELDAEDRAEVLRALTVDDRAAIEENLSYPDESAGRMMQRDLVALPEFWTVGQAIDFLRSEDESIPSDFYDIFVVDPGHKPVGSVPLSRIMRSARNISLGEIKDDDLHLVDVAMDKEEVAYRFTKYHLISAAVIDAAGRVVGVITVDDVIEVIEDEAEEDLLALAGVSSDLGVNEGLTDIIKNRFLWLFVNLGTAVMASIVIGLFEGTIEQMVALAVLMPIIASMGGNAATQTMTVAVRAIATKELTSLNAMRVLNREVIIATVNGAALAVIAGTISWLWYDNITLGLVFAFALVFNMIVAGACGLLTPLTLNRFGIDPAIASSVFVTTVTDVVGFFVFLGVAAAVLL
ncbi:magnesium transporter MgtE [Kordiimonas sediminis]|uniref:Magnesium transporter MgtE n=1 Tax=Kordiimonas sediminis TaxID=1735581 RepID=A0A919AUU5_9PROT|nr:magnesium transporter [Kordiimonas sediminis]GHF24685.1 magnesium transporter MgtE [Kordiimonas sediminis]